ncbi:hypothetical protein QQS21_012571 [Conoideocrella luteorostrata]|uniref:Uncharacterized protein n=1 Tax=Conoideocrella luteorostrata TaxID=1105319 RepID=A0AAJ0FM84_9HYPO|nr:hypothetical protein QQS21_012571 [Conoideocrella luteorostrata]
MKLTTESRTYRIFRRVWPIVSKKGTAWLMPLELIGLVPMLVIFGISQPDMYRTTMWEIGFQNKLNSNPNMILYAYANYQPLPKVPLVWSQSLTDFNVAISVISLFFLLAKLISFIMKIWYPLAAVLVNCAMVALYAVSTYGQIGPDYADARYPAPAAWYFRQGCDLARKYGKYRSCQIAQASLFITLYMLLLYVLNLGFAAYAMWPSPLNDVDEVEDDQFSTSSDPKDQYNWEMQGMKSPASVRESPFTPRTQAFRTLDRQLPLRQQQGSRYS